MQVPLTVSFQGLEVDEAIRSACWTEAERLEHYFPRIVSCHVTVAQPHRRHHIGNHFALHVRLAVPGSEIVVNRDPATHSANEEPRLAVHQAFDEVRRQLQDYVRKLRGDVKHHEPKPSGPGPGASEY